VNVENLLEPRADHLLRGPMNTRARLLPCVNRDRLRDIAKPTNTTIEHHVHALANLRSDPMENP